MSLIPQSSTPIVNCVYYNNINNCVVNYNSPDCINKLSLQQQIIALVTALIHVNCVNKNKDNN